MRGRGPWPPAGRAGAWPDRCTPRQGRPPRDGASRAPDRPAGTTAGRTREHRRAVRSLEAQQDRPAQTGRPREIDDAPFDQRTGVRRASALGAAPLVIALSAGPALACGGLIGPNGAVNLLRTTTLAGYHDGEEHYVTAFQFAGGGGAFGSLTPLPGIPSSVEKGGDWTLQRLVRETDPVPEFDGVRAAAAAAPAAAEELMKVRIDALDITVLRGGSRAVGQWATEHGFRLPPDAPEVLDFYAARSPIFLAAVFDADAAARARPGGRRRDAGPRHDPDRQPVGPAADPGPRQDAGRAGRRPTSTC